MLNSSKMPDEYFHIAQKRTGRRDTKKMMCRRGEQFGATAPTTTSFGRFPLAWAVVMLFVSTIIGLQPRQVSCTSSYIDEYFLPTAKLALNKIQQSFSAPPPQQLQLANQTAVGIDSPTIERLQQGNSDIYSKPARNSTSDPIASKPPTKDNNDNPLASSSSGGSNPTQSTKIEETRPNESWMAPAATTTTTTTTTTTLTNQDLSRSNKIDETQQQLATTSETLPISISSTESSSSDPTNDIKFNQLGGEQDDDQQQSVVGQLANKPQQSAPNKSDEPEADVASTSEQVASTTTAESKILPEVGVEPDQPAVVLSPVDEVSIRETEHEAVAAVDASISFGGDLFGSSADSCYDEYGNARFCEPDFDNLAAEKSVEVSSECGQPATRFCTATYSQDARNDQIRNCHICDAQHPKKRHPASYLTDINNPNAPTCWVSAPISTSNMSQWDGGSLDQAGGRLLYRDNVTLTLHLNKAHEITYVSMQFCSLKPDSLAIYKSADFGLTWTPFHFFSSQCNRVYGLEQTPTAGRDQQAKTTPTGSAQASSNQNSSGERLEATCTNGTGSTSGATSGPHQATSPARVAFSALDASRRASSWRASQDWITATDLKIVLDRHQLNWIQSSLAYSHHHQAHPQQQASSAQPRNRMLLASNWSSDAAPSTGAAGQQKVPVAQQEVGQLEASLTNPSDSYNYAIADLTIGGRCKCNGHASRCIHGPDGGLQCDCRHNTAGRDCERCASFHFDRPWQPASQFDANPCQPCQCNGHSRRCRFDPEIYQLSGRRSGGVCTYCRDNTAGRHCHYCRQGFTRDHSKPMSDKGACKPCDCHPLGSLGSVCNQTSGQCPCKEGVTGLECNRCAAGYQQSSSPSEPCIKLPENDINYEPTIEVSDGGGGEQQTGVEANPSSEESSSSSISDADSNGAHASPPVGAGTRYEVPMATNQLGDFEPGSDSDPSIEQPAVVGDGSGKFGQAQYGRQRPHQHQFNSWQARRHQGANYNPKYGSARRPVDFSDPDSDEEPEGMSDVQPDGDEFPQSPIGAVYPQQLGDNLYHPNNRQPQLKRPMLNEHRSIGGRARNNKQPAIRVQKQRPALVANLDEPTDGLDIAGDDRSQFGRFGPASEGASFAMADESEFNQIMAGAYHPSMSNGQSSSGSRRNQFRAGKFHRQHQQGSSLTPDARHRLSGGDESLVAMRHQNQLGAQFGQTDNSIACADCQSGTKKLSRHQFCHLDYAIKAQVLSKFMAEDWTRFEVEIQDIFKSPSGLGAAATSSVMQQQQQIASARNFANLKSAANFADNLALYQADEPSSTGNGNKTESSDGNSLTVDRQQQFAPAQSHHRLKIGSVQSIWVPTEDVGCKCPRLKVKSTYLLMGLVDTKENSATSIQLDRHGVALEWKSSLQDKLIKHQRRSARKGC